MRVRLGICFNGFSSMNSAVALSCVQVSDPFLTSQHNTMRVKCAQSSGISVRMFASYSS